MSKIRAIRRDALEEAPGTPGITRYLALEGDDYVIVRSKADPGVVSAWHHHGDHDVCGLILSGQERFEFGPGGEEAILVGEVISSTFRRARFTGMSIRLPMRCRRPSFSSEGRGPWSSIWTGPTRPSPPVTGAVPRMEDGYADFEKD